MAAADINHDGLVDIAAGDLWYEAPNWTPHEVRPLGTYVFDKGYSQCFCEWAHDINGDGWMDLIIVGFPGEPFSCYENPKYENPKDAAGHWKKHLIWDSICNESPAFTDLTGDGIPEVMLGSEAERQMGYLSVPPIEKCYDKWHFQPISEAGEPNENGTFRYYHGLGIADLNGDGRKDVVIPHGWWEAPETTDAIEGGTAGLWDLPPAQAGEGTRRSPVTCLEHSNSGS